VLVGAGVMAGEHEAKIMVISKTVMMSFIFIDTLLCKGRANGLRYLPVGAWIKLEGREKLKRRKS